MNRRTHQRERSNLLSLCLHLSIIALTTCPTWADPPACSQAPVFADDLAASGYTPPPPINKGYFTSDINLNGSGNLAIIGEIFGGGNGSSLGPGRARFYSLTGGAWEQVAAIQATNPVNGDGFGSSVDVSGRFAIVTAPNRSNAQHSPVGAVYFFENDNGWHQRFQLFNPNANPNDGFGGSLTRHETAAIYDRLAVVAASETTVTVGEDDFVNAGVVYIYFYDYVADVWELEATLTSPNPIDNEGFGYSVDLYSTRVIVGAPFALGSDAGSAYIFNRTTPGGVPTWTLEDTLVGDSVSGDDFGWSVSIDGTAAAVGSPEYQNGHVYVFNFNSGTGQWDESADLLPPVASTGQGLGYNVCLSGTQLLAGAQYYPPAGTAYLWELSGGTWSAVRQLLSTTATADGDRVGETLAIKNDEALVGTLGEDDPNTQGQQHGGLLIFSNVSDCQ